ncbi:MAG: GreA/GreB family elongation factor [Firmicutes bacterium]|jgi:transcription elongation factor GreA|nr:GreA/GreB family elongation factor [Bacillota bacterium]
MTSEVRQSDTIFTSLGRQLAEIEAGKRKLLEQYFPEPSQERDAFEALLDKYIRQLAGLLQGSKEQKHAVNSEVPFVTIGSAVEVVETEANEIYRYRIVNPENVNPGAGDISYLSPVGKSLLLKKVGDEVVVKAPGGVFRYRIKAIEWADAV